MQVKMQQQFLTGISGFFLHDAFSTFFFILVIAIAGRSLNFASCRSNLSERSCQRSATAIHSKKLCLVDTNFIYLNEIHSMSVDRTPNFLIERRTLITELFPPSTFRISRTRMRVSTICILATWPVDHTRFPPLVCNIRFKTWYITVRDSVYVSSFPPPMFCLYFYFQEHVNVGWKNLHLLNFRFLVIHRCFVKTPRCEDWKE